MTWPVTIAGRTFTLADFSNWNYLDSLPELVEKVGDVAAALGDVETAQEYAEAAETAANDALASALAAQLAAGAITSAVGVVTPEQFGAVADNDAVDNKIFLQAFFDYLDSNKVPGVIPARRYRLNSGLTLKGGVLLDCVPGACFDIRGASSSTIALTASGTIEAAVTITGGALMKGATALPVAAGAEAGFAAGDLVKVTSLDVYDPARGDSRKGETVYLSATSSGVLTLETGLLDNYDTTPIVRKVNPLTGLVTKGRLKILGTGDPAHSQQGLRLTYGVNCLIDGLVTDGLSSVNIILNDCLNSYVMNPSARNARHGVTGYGIDFGLATRNCWAFNVTAYRVRHAFTVGGGGAAGEPGVVRDCGIRVGYADKTTGDGWDAHGNFERLTLIDCISKESAAQGFNLEGGTVTLIRPKSLKSVSTGINCVSGVEDRTTSVTIVDPVVEDSGGKGINIGTAPFVAPTNEPGGIVSVNLRGWDIKRSTGVPIVIARPSTYTKPPKRVLLGGGNIEGSLAAICLQMDFVENFHLVAGTIDGVLESASAIRLTSCQRGVVLGLNADFVASASGVGVNLNACTDVVVDYVTVTGETPTTLKGIGWNSACSGIRIGAHNNLSATITPISPGAVDFPSEATVLLPYVAPSFPIQLGDGLTPKRVSTIEGARKGDRQIFRAINGVGAVTLVHGEGNIYLKDAKDLILDSTLSYVELVYDNITGSAYGWKQVSEGRNQTPYKSIGGNITVTDIDLARPLYADADTGAILIKLPDPLTVAAGTKAVVRKIDSTANRVTVQLDGVATDLVWLSKRSDEAEFWIVDGVWTLVRTDIAPVVFIINTSVSGTFTKPPGAKYHRVRAVGGGGGGGSGRNGAASTVRVGGAGGNAGNIIEATILDQDLPASVGYIIGTGGAGAAAILTNDTNGSAGGNGTGSTFGATTDTFYIRTPTVNGGAGGTATTVTQAVVQHVAHTTGQGASPSGTGGVGVTPVIGLNVGGASGGGITSANVSGAGGDGRDRALSGTSVPGGAAPGGAGTQIAMPTITSPITYSVAGGAGAGGSGAVQGGAGASGIGHGTGGSGGGAGTNGFGSGAGGAGAPGALIVESYFR